MKVCSLTVKVILILLKLSLIGGGGISKVEIKFDKIRENFD